MPGWLGTVARPRAAPCPTAVPGTGLSTWPPPGQRLGVAGLILLGHGVLALGLAVALRPAPVPAAGKAAPALLWLQPLRVANPAATAPTRPSTVPAGAAAAAPQATHARPVGVKAPSPAGATPPVPVSLPVSGGVPPAAALTGALLGALPGALPAGLPASAPPAPLGQPALNLALPRGGYAPGSARQPGAGELLRGDARLPAPASRDERLARALGTDLALQEQARGDVLRLRQGRGCVDLLPSRAGQLNPFNQSSTPAPRQATPC